MISVMKMRKKKIKRKITKKSVKKTIKKIKKLETQINLNDEEDEEKELTGNNIKKSETESKFKIDIISKENKIETKENNSNNPTKINIATDKGNIDLTLDKDIVNIMNSINIEINEEKTQINNMKDNQDEIEKKGFKQKG